MSHLVGRRTLVLLALTLSAFAGACSATDIGSPQPQRSSTAHDEADGSSCPNGFTIVDAHVVCN